MERVDGIGGLFFRSRDPQALNRWYEEHLGINQVPSSYDEEPWRQAAGPRYMSQSTSSIGGCCCGVDQPLILHPMPPGCAWTAVSLPSLPVRASSQANAKCGRFRRWVPAWNTRPYRFIVSARSWQSPIVMPHGFSE